MKLEDVPNVVLVASGKGGVGKTTVSSDLARKASEVLPGKVGLIDADISTPNSTEVLGGEDVDLEGQRLATHDSLVPPEVGGVQLVSKGIVLPDDVPVLRGAEWRSKTVMDYVESVDWDPDTELVVIDSPPGSGEEIQVVVSAAPITHAYVVSTPHPSSVRDAKKTHEFFDQSGVDHSVVTNMAYIPGEDIAAHASGVDFTGIPGIGDGKQESIEEVLTENVEDMDMFGHDPEEDVDIDADHTLTLPYTEDGETRRAVWENEIDDTIAADQEVEA